MSLMPLTKYQSQKHTKMSGVKKISRTDLYSDSEPEVDNNEVILPKLEFEIVEANTTQEKEDEIMEDSPREEFDFPLFSFGGGASVEEEDKKSEDAKEGENEIGRGRTLEKQTIRVSLRSPSPEVIVQGRPESYYFARYDDEQQRQFADVALTGDDIINQSGVKGYFSMGRVVNLKEHNALIERELMRDERQKKIRPGKKKRLATIESRKRNQERAKIQREIEKKKQRKLQKKAYHRRGGKKNKKTAASNPTAAASNGAKPRYRTE